MENYSIIIFILAIVIGLSAFADTIKLPQPILLVIVGIAIGFIPTMTEIEINPEIIFLIFLPPLLYDASFNISPKDFKTNINTIGALAVSLVFMTAAGIAVVAYLMIPGMTWPLAFVLGAILSATDAVAAISITKGLKLSHKTLTILEGESLINDASALVAYRFAVAAVLGSSFIIWKATLEFIFLLGGGFLVGFVMAKILAFILNRVHKNVNVTISFMLLMPFVAYLVAEHLHVSGVIAVVILGLAIARFSNKIFPESLKNQSKSLWDIIIFLLNGLIFILIGLNFRYILKDIDEGMVLPYIGYAAIITVVALLIRMARIFLQKINLQKAFQNGKGKRKISEHALLDFNNSIILSWSGMRGIVSLAIAIGLPKFLEDGTPFPERNAIIFISVAVVLLTLIGQGLTLPLIVKKLNPKKTEKAPS
ncbi:MULTISPECIES: Na+/H+ antiporter [unclassified Flavobacterium]|uniref:Na+/H+ antiporter n=1 Tax=unclassified Flavobacterium TaxID=196869 RepID=UPI00070CE67D|nr:MULTISPECIES: Na+/H+ antiporter [unclassified Flavobacterium]KRD58201.1 sodium:proton exchanger [Flavobacterium sp. Root935]TDX11770.1 CPA1 family monovalent cation:H+ antiporter [Flavobacterium sp. S87F.05.LMB.W.Kidney.N]BDU25703.1 Na+/H+ antiporter [Flavobacterium sp. GSB-24]